VRLRVILVLLCCAIGTAQAETSFDIPPGYVERPGVPGAALDEMRATRAATLSGDMTELASPDGEVSLVRMRWTFWLGEELSRAALEKVDQELEASIAEEMFSGVKHVSTSRRFVDDQLVALSADELGEAQFRVRRLYSVDALGFVHLFAIVCAGPTDQLGYCDKAQRSMKQTVAYQLPLSELPKHGVRRQPSPGWSRGHTIGTAALIALIVGLASWIYTSASRRDRRRRRRRRH
jgi:hypothetical protein